MPRIHHPKPNTWIYHPKRKQRVGLYLSGKDNVWSKKLKLFAEKTLGLDGPISIRRAAKEADVHRETAGKFLDIMERNDLLMSTLVGVPPKTRKLYFVSDGTLLEEFETLIRNQPGYLRDVYRDVGELIGDSLNVILPFLDTSTSWSKAKKQHDLPDELDEFYGKLKIIRDRWLSNSDRPAIETDKVRVFNDWGPDSQKLIEDLENALWTWALSQEISTAVS